MPTQWQLSMGTVAVAVSSSSDLFVSICEASLVLEETLGMAARANRVIAASSGRGRGQGSGAWVLESDRSKCPS